MTEIPQNLPQSDAPIDAAQLLQSLRRKEGSWVEWGRHCQTLQKAGHSPQSIFEATGFEPIQQNQLTVAVQVFDTILKVGVTEAVQAHFEQKGSDILYELRILTQSDRAAVAALVVERNLDLDEAHEIAKVMQDYARMGTLPAGFTAHPGDAIAHQSWKLARQKADLQERSRLIARGLRFAHSEAARKQVEKLLTDFSVTQTRQAPRLPLYRLDAEEPQPRILPVVGRLPLTKADLQTVPLVEEIQPFGMVQFSGTAAWVPIPGWQVILAAEDPIVILCDSELLPTPVSSDREEVLVVIDRAQRTWNGDRYFILEQAEQLAIQWFEQAPDRPLLGQVILIMRPKKVLDESYTNKLLSGEQLNFLERWSTEE